MSNTGGENEDVASYHPTYNLDSNDTSFEPDFQAPTAQTQQQGATTSESNKSSSTSVAPPSPGEMSVESKMKDDDDNESAEGVSTAAKNPLQLHAPDAWLFEELNQPDEIMETDVLSALGRFLQAGGSPEVKKKKKRV